MSNLKTCKKCGEDKVCDHFHKNNQQVDGYHVYCKPCRKVAAESYYKKNKIKINDTNKRHYQRNKEMYLGYTISRRYNQRQATPLWDKELTDFTIKEAYSLAKIRKKETGIDWHVDHIIPLKGKLVCGLNVWNNIQLLPAEINLRKKNNYDIV